MKIKKLFKINVVLLIILLIIPTNVETIENYLFEIKTINAKTEEQESFNFKEMNTNLTIDTDVRIPSNLTEEQYNKMLEGTNLYGLGKALVQAENDYQVNGLYLLGLACLESAYGSSGYAIKRNNLVGWNAIDSNPDNATYFESQADCILFVASKLQQNYLTEGGAYFEGYTPKDIDVHYCTDKQHANKICQIVANLKNRI